jgi:hypothetical protein
MLMRKFRAIVQDCNYVPGSFQIVQHVKNGKKPRSSRGVIGRSRGYGNGEVIESAKFLLAVDLGVQDEPWEQYPPAINIIQDLHIKWARLTDRRQEALLATQPIYLEVEGHYSTGGYYYTVDQDLINQWVEAAKFWLRQHS